VHHLDELVDEARLLADEFRLDFVEERGLKLSFERGLELHQNTPRVLYSIGMVFGVMAETTRTIRADDQGVSVETRDPDGDLVTMRFSVVHLLSNGWVECREPGDEPDRKNFFPPAEVQNIVVYDEDGQSGTWG
jgi:hypothetical protein